MSKEVGPPSDPSGLPDPREFLDYLRTEAENRRMEHEVAAENNRLTVGFAEKELLVIADDRKDERKFRGQESTKRLVAVGVGLILIGALIILLIDRQQSTLALEIVRAIVYIGAGGAGGYGIGKVRGSKSSSSKEE